VTPIALLAVDFDIDATQEAEPLGRFESVITRGKRRSGEDVTVGYPSTSLIGKKPYEVQTDINRLGACEALSEHLYKVLVPNRLPSYKLQGGHRLLSLEPGEIYTLTLSYPSVVTAHYILIEKKLVKGRNFLEDSRGPNLVEITAIDVDEICSAHRDVLGVSTFTSSDLIW
jgi:hypothetical protein